MCRPVQSVVMVSRLTYQNASAAKFVPQDCRRWQTSEASGRVRDSTGSRDTVHHHTHMQFAIFTRLYVHVSAHVVEWLSQSMIPVCSPACSWTGQRMLCVFCHPICRLSCHSIAGKEVVPVAGLSVPDRGLRPESRPPKASKDPKLPSSVLGSGSGSVQCRKASVE